MEKHVGFCNMCDRRLTLHCKACYMQPLIGLKYGALHPSKFKPENTNEKISGSTNDTPHIDYIRAKIESDVLKNILKVMDAQTQKGLSKYGKTVNPHDNYNWIDMAIEECTDMLVYLHCLKIQKTAE